MTVALQRGVENAQLPLEVRASVAKEQVYANANPVAQGKIPVLHL
ncbi:MAG TPA: hypothetical protein VMQ50_13255 [Casimicrobiaceae bacterium]|nr:hypothetical protein [Casimicrobiaceae bacterium]